MLKYMLVIAAALLVAANLAQARSPVYGGSISQGAMDGMQQQRVDNCIRACGADGYCQAQCIAAGQPQRAEPAPYYQPIPTSRTDPNCLSNLQNARVPEAQAQAWCTR